MAKKTENNPERNYHHGNLKQALLDAALALIESDDGKNLSLRTVAMRAGVSPGAPYRHFKDREAILAALATIGFDRLLKSIRHATAGGSDSSRLLETATAYQMFASKNQGLYRLMFTENHLAIRFDEAFARSSTAAFLELERAVIAQLPINRGDGHARLVATTIWATLHGAAMLAFECLIPAGGPPDEEQAKTVSTAIAKLLIDSLAR